MQDDWFRHSSLGSMACIAVAGVCEFGWLLHSDVIRQDQNMCPLHISATPRIPTSNGTNSSATRTRTFQPVKLPPLYSGGNQQVGILSVDGAWHSASQATRPVWSEELGELAQDTSLKRKLSINATQKYHGPTRTKHSTVTESKQSLEP